MTLTPAEYATYDAVGLADLLLSREVAPRELIESALGAVDSVNGELNAVVEVYDDRFDVRDELKGSFGSVPTLMKDLGDIEPGRFVEFGSRLGLGNRSPSATHLADRIRSSGLVSVGRTATSELAIAGVTETSAFGPTRSPWSSRHSSGGSSGGAGAAVGSGMVPIAQGSDGGGSIRIPAACCGVVGLKPTRGRISSAPSGAALAGFSTSFVLTRTIRDAALALDVLSGSVPGDPAPIAGEGRSYLGSLDLRVPRLRVALALKSFSGHLVDPQVLGTTSRVAEVLAEMGHEIEVHQPKIEWQPFLSAMALMWAADAAQLADWLSQRTGRPVDENHLEAQTLAICEEGRRLTALELLETNDVFNSVSRQIGRFFDDFDLLLTPTLGQLPPQVGRYKPEGSLDSTSFFGSWADVESFLPLFNCSGNPAISLPVALSAEGLPIGVQVVGRYGDDITVLNISRSIEQAMPWAHRIPTIHVSNRRGHGR